MIYSVTKKYCSLKTCRIRISIFLLFNGFVLSLSASPKHAADTNYPSYHGLVMAGYQGWFHKPEKGMMYPDEKNVRIDMWPDVSEYPETYPTGLKHADGSTARFFCSSDESTVDLHFRWMKRVWNRRCLYAAFLQTLPVKITQKGMLLSVMPLKQLPSITAQSASCMICQG